MTKMQIGMMLRYPREFDTTQKLVEGLPNFHHFTHDASFALPLPRLWKGICQIRSVKAVDGPRVPAIIVVSSFHKAGSADAPWEDLHDIDNGHIRYFGDNRNPGVEPARTRGNKALLRAFDRHEALDLNGRRASEPLLFFRRMQKGVLEFAGVGVIARAERIVQHDRAAKSYFTNYVFDVAVLDLSAEKDALDWRWIHARRREDTDLTTTEPLAPRAWRDWLAGGAGSLDRCRRRVSRSMVQPKETQLPNVGTAMETVLKKVYTFFSGKSGREKWRFEALAAAVSASVLRSSGRYREGWITPASGDGGSDFIARLDMGDDFSTTRLIIFGQAKCERPDKTTGGRHVARTVARLKRGWLGVYVTTGWFSKAVQLEIIEDGWPVLLVPGLRLAQEVQRIADERGISIDDYLPIIASSYEKQVTRRRPEEILVLP